VTDRPLTPGDFFANREPSFRRLREALEVGQTLFLLYGIRRIGKTSFVKQLPTRLGANCRLHRVAWAPSKGADLLWESMVAAARDLACEEPDEEAYVQDPTGYAQRHFATCLDAMNDRASPRDPSNPTHLICLDALASANSKRGWEESLQAFLEVSTGVEGLALLLVVERAQEADAHVDGICSLVLDALDRDDTYELLMTPVGGVMTYDYAAIRRIHRLSGGEPFLTQLFGSILFERRASAGWVGLPEVEQCVDEVIAEAASLFQGRWQECGPLARLVLCAFAEMMGHHGVGSVDDVELHLSQLGFQIPSEDVAAGLDELVSLAILDRMGGDIYRFKNDLFRHWLRQNRDVVEVARELSGYRRRRVRRGFALREERVDWVALLLWGVAGMLVFLIVFLWRSRQRHAFWTGEPTPTAVAAAAAATSTPTVVLPTPQKGVAPGNIVYMGKEKAEDTWEIYRMRSDGSDPVRLTQNNVDDMSPVWAPDGRHIAFVSRRDGNREIYVMNADGNEQINLTLEPADDWTPAWSPDGAQLAFASFRDGNWEIYVMDADGENQRRLTQSDAADYGPTWSPDGTRLAYVSDRDGNLNIYIMDVDGGEQRRLTRDEATDQSPVWSPQDAQVLWESYRDGNMEVYAANADGTELRNISQDSYADDHGPVRSPWGDRVAYYSNRDGGWDIYTLDLASGQRANVTQSAMLEQAPHWGP
jgi:Tol biopolymer transport system component